MQAFLNSSDLPTITVEELGALNASVSLDEVRKTIQKLKAGKSPGPDGFTNSYYKAFTDTLGPHLVPLFNNILAGEQIPAELNAAEIILFPKKGRDPLEMKNYRPISLLNCDMKILSKIMSDRLACILPRLIHNDQVGFVAHRKAEVNIRKVLNLIHKAKTSKQPAYIVFLKTFIETAERYFMVGHKVSYYVFTDRAIDIPKINLRKGRRLVILEVPSYQRWQEVSMRRMQMINYYVYKSFINEVDYLVCVDVDMRFSDEVGVEILSNMVGTLHPGFFKASRRSYTYERRPESEAYIPADEGDFYYAGGFFGGTVEEVYKLTKHCHNAMMRDKAKRIEAIWHDESYLNKYFLYHKPTKILSPEYLWANSFRVPDVLKRRRFVAVSKNNTKIRNMR
ncbi:histo-blood group ABO system transferase-like [Discoglossus pictus]